MKKKLNIVLIHTHDMGRFCQPMGYDIPAPNLMRLAKQGTLFRKCFSSAPTCGPSRAAMMTGQHPHVCGMLGLPSPKLEYQLNDYQQHLSWFLKKQGYETAISGVEHEVPETLFPKEDVLGYDHYLNHTPTEQQDFVAPMTAHAAVEFLMEKHERPFFLSVGFLDPHRDNRDDRRIFIESQPMTEPADIDERARYCQPWPNVPDTAETRREMANFKMGVELMDEDVGRVLKVLDSPELRNHTLVIFTTDHGPGVAEMKGSLYDRGTGVMTIIRGPSDPSYGDACRFNGGKVIDGMTQHIDLYPTLCELIGTPPPAWLQGRSLLPLVSGAAEEIHDEVFTEQTYHFDDSPRPLRAVRTTRYKYIRSFKKDQPRGIDNGPVQALLNQYGYRDRLFEDHMLYDLIFDPNEACNLASHPDYGEALKDMQGRLERWMRETNDPLIDGVIPEPPAARRRRE